MQRKRKLLAVVYIKLGAGDLREFSSNFKKRDLKFTVADQYERWCQCIANIRLQKLVWLIVLGKEIADVKRVPLNNCLYCLFIYYFVISQFCCDLRCDSIKEISNGVYLLLFVLVHTNTRLLPNSETMCHRHPFDLCNKLLSDTKTLILVCLSSQKDFKILLYDRAIDRLILALDKQKGFFRLSDR